MAAVPLSIGLDTGHPQLPRLHYNLRHANKTIESAEQKAIYDSRDTYVICLLSWALKVLMIVGSMVGNGVVLGFSFLALVWIEPSIVSLVWLKHPRVCGLPRILVALQLSLDAAYMCTWAVLYYWDANVGRLSWWGVTALMSLHTGFMVALLRAVVNVQHSVLAYYLIKSHLRALVARFAEQATR
jgi:hypothetical protein